MKSLCYSLFPRQFVRWLVAAVARRWLLCASVFNFVVEKYGVWVRGSRQCSSSGGVWGSTVLLVQPA